MQLIIFIEVPPKHSIQPFCLQEAEKLLVVDFPFVVKLLEQDITDASLKKLVGDPLLREIDKVSVEPIEAVKNLSERKK